MIRQRLNLEEDDLKVLARALDTDGESLRGELDRRPVDGDGPHVGDGEVVAGEADRGALRHAATLVLSQRPGRDR